MVCRRLGLLSLIAIGVPIAVASTATASTFSISNFPAPTRGGCGVASGGDRFSATSDSLVGDAIDANVVGPSSFCRITAGAFAGPGAIGAGTALRGEGLSNTGYFATAEAEMDDFVISSNVVPDGDEITTRILLDVSGELDTVIDGGQSIATADVRLTVRGAGASFSDTWDWRANAFPGEPDSTFVLGGLASRFFTVRVGETFTVTLGLRTDSIIVGLRAQGVAEAAFSNTLTFNTDGAVFELPEGATVNAPSANIADNRYSVIPEPSTALLLLLGLAGLHAGASRDRV